MEKPDLTTSSTAKELEAGSLEIEITASRAQRRRLQVGDGVTLGSAEGDIFLAYVTGIDGDRVALTLR